MSNDQSPLEINVAYIQNKIIGNSTQGMMMYDEGPWSEAVANIMDKDHGLCRQPNTANMCSSRGGLSDDLKDEYMTDTNSIIHRSHTEVELDIFLQGVIVKYGHKMKPRNFIKSVVEKKHKIFHKYIHDIFFHPWSYNYINCVL